jgi:hypothetical protein
VELLWALGRCASNLWHLHGCVGQGCTAAASTASKPEPGSVLCAVLPQLQRCTGCSKARACASRAALQVFVQVCNPVHSAVQQYCCSSNGQHANLLVVLDLGERYPSLQVHNYLSSLVCTACAHEVVAAVSRSPITKQSISSVRLLGQRLLLC